MTSYTPKISSDKEFKEEIIYLSDFFEGLSKSGKLSEGLKYIKEIRLNWIYDVVFNNKKFEGDKSKVIVTRDIEDSYQDGIDFLKSNEGERFIDVLHYFAKFYKI